jgi:hypothetical protein
VAYLVKAFIGAALFIGSVIVFNVELQKLLDIGTCASGNTPYQISRPCPEGTGTKILLVMGSVFAGLIGCAIFAFRGDPPWGERKRSVGFFGLGTLAWGIFFAGTGVALLLGKPYGQITDPQTGEVVANAGSQLGATITAVTFLIMGVPALLLGLWNSIRGMRGGRDERPAASGLGDLTGGLAGSIKGMGSSFGGSSSSTASAGTTTRFSGKRGGGDAIAKIERLQKLRESGALTDAEFDKEKAKILAEQ